MNLNFFRSAGFKFAWQSLDGVAWDVVPLTVVVFSELRRQTAVMKNSMVEAEISESAFLRIPFSTDHSETSMEGIGLSLEKLFDNESQKSTHEFPKDLRSELAAKHFIFIDGI